MNLWKNRLLSAAFAGLVALAGSTARADFQLIIVEDGGAAIAITDGGPLDADGVVNGRINARANLVNAALTSYQFAGLSATSNNAPFGGTPGTADSARITQTGELSRIAGAAGTGITIIANDTSYLFPQIPLTLGSSASDTFTNTVAGSSRTFQSYFDQSNTDLSDISPVPVGTPSALLAFLAPAGIGPFATSGNAPPTALVGATVPYALTNVTRIVLTPGTNPSAPPSDQFTGSTTVIGVIPEPASVLSLAFGLPALGLVLRRRRRTA